MGDFTVCSLKVTLGPVRLLVNICRLTQTRDLRSAEPHDVAGPAGPELKDWGGSGDFGRGAL